MTAKKLFTLIFSIFYFSVLLWSEVPEDYRFVKTWKLADKFGRVDSVRVDTAHLNFQDDNAIDKFSIANSYNGNLGSPIQSKIYFDRPEMSDFMFFNTYYPYITQIETSTFYNTKTPLSMIKYLSGGSNYRKEEEIGFMFTANANKRLNFGTTLDYISAKGEYSKQSAKRFAGSIFGSYDGKRYSAIGLLSTNNLRNYENGGITETDYLTNPAKTSVKPINIPVKMLDNVMSNYRHSQIYYNQQFSLGFERPAKGSKDTTKMEFIPVTRFAHSIRIDDMRKRYFENSVQTAYYDSTYLDLKQTNDTAALQKMTNRFSISLAEEFNKWMRFGLTAYVENDFEKYTFTPDTLLQHQTESNTRVGAILSKELGQKFTYMFLGEINLVGYKMGDFNLETQIGSSFRLLKDTISIRAKGFMRNSEPSFFLQNYQSNHFRWSNNFDKTFRTHIGGTFAIPTRSFSLDVNVENITNQIYFDTLALPSQFDGNIQIVSAQLKQDFRLGKFTLENNVVYQLSSNQDVIPLPMLTLYHNLYFHDKWFKVLSAQFGANVRYHTAYYAPAYMPATGQFYSQDEMKIGNYPIVNVYANFHLKRTRFFVEYYHVNQLFMKGVYYSMPYYPINPAMLKIGLTWNFYD